MIVEALAFNCNVISSDCHSGPKEILENGKWGKLFPVGNHHSLSKAIIKISNDNIFHNNRIRAEDFSIEKIGSQYNDMFNQILDS